MSLYLDLREKIHMQNHIQPHSLEIQNLMDSVLPSACVKI